MSIGNSDKIFVDVDDEINFVVEKILAAEKERVIIVIPQNALVVSSLVSMKIMAKQVVKSKKVVVLVTEDDFGQKLAKQSGLVAAHKVSEITPELWEAAIIAKEKAKEEILGKKKELLTERGILPADTDEPITDDLPAEPEIQELAADPEPEVEQIAEDDVESDPELTEIPKPAMAERVKLTPPKGKETRVPDMVNEVEESVSGPIKRTKRQPKLVEVSGFKVYAGGDIASLGTDSMATTESQTAEAGDAASDRLSRVRSVQAGKTSGSFTGRDWTSYTEPGKKGIQFPKLFKRTPKVEPGERKILSGDPLSELVAKRKKAIIAVAIFLVAVLIGAYILLSQLTSVEVRLKLKTAEVPVEQQITADVAVTEIDTENLVIHAELVEEADLSISASDNSTGEGKTGNRAAGVIEIWNFTDAEVQVSAGTVAQNTTTNLKYLIKQDVTVPAATSAGAIVDPGIVQDVRVEAETFGENYNMLEIGTMVDFKVGDHSTDDLKGKRFSKFEGGTTETFKAPSQADIDRIKDGLVESLQKQGTTKVQTRVPEGYRLLPETIQFEETESHSTPAIGEKGDTFSLTVEGKVTALAVSEDDLTAAIEALIAKNQAEDVQGEFVVSNLDNAEILNVARDGNKVTFTIVSKGSLQSNVTEQDIKDAIKGRSERDADDHLLSVEEIKSVRVIFSPGFLPDFMKVVPNDDNKIKVVFE
ncbi:hypothetical protein KC640_02600 [Candidatus Dojkabacteria bacterium]|uniref:Baseplate protein J-like domain-containing protein n=1 Tax=Candidatus Dojkabacteria bacterium TaxID=2099670 RepID=A0A955KZN5_9BACT|nr:hypothetical protein [Candidatus Dojkabacteria bacterium]